MQLKKIMASLGVLFCLCSNSTVVAYANTTVPPIDDDISLAYEIANDTSSNLSIENKTGYCVSSASGFNTVSITVTQTLQKYCGLWIWNDVKDAKWTTTEDSDSISFSNSKGDLDSGTYRVKSVFTLTNIYGKSETTTVYSSEQKIS